MQSLSTSSYALELCRTQRFYRKNPSQCFREKMVWNWPHCSTMITVKSPPKWQAKGKQPHVLTLIAPRNCQNNDPWLETLSHQPEKSDRQQKRRCFLICSLNNKMEASPPPKKKNGGRGPGPGRFWPRPSPRARSGGLK